MPAKSKAMLRFMEAVAHGGIVKPGLSPEKAKEFVKENKGSRAYSKLKERLGVKK